MRTIKFTIGLFVLATLVAGGATLSAQRGQARGRGGAYMPMSGTYELETGRGDSAERAAASATRGLNVSQRNRAYQNLLVRLQPPAVLAIERDGRMVTISSSNGPRATFEADGRTRNEQGPNGRMTVSRAEFIGDRLTVSTTGNRSTDFTVTFEPMNGGSNLLVTRRMDSEDLQRPVTVRSFYRRTATQTRWDLYDGDRGNRGYRPGLDSRSFAMAEGTRIVAVLDNGLSTNNSRRGERFSMTVQDPQEYAGARIEGTIARVTPYGQGRNVDMAIDFDTIRLRNGQTSEFDGVLSTVRTPGGGTFRVDASGEPLSDRSDTSAVQGGAIGAALGAIIGAVAGGGKGAAIGAVAGGAGGAILAQDRDQNLDLPPGTQVTILVRSPGYGARR